MMVISNKFFIGSVHLLVVATISLCFTPEVQAQTVTVVSTSVTHDNATSDTGSATFDANGFVDHADSLIWSARLEMNINAAGGVEGRGLLPNWVDGSPIVNKGFANAAHLNSANFTLSGTMSTTQAANWSHHTTGTYKMRVIIEEWLNGSPNPVVRKTVYFDWVHP